MEEIFALLKEGDAEKIADFMKANDLILVDGKITGKSPEVIAFFLEQEKFYNARQQARKILLNSLYGALLNEAMRLSDARMGQSTTLTGRSIARHMNSQVNMEIVGVYDHTGEAVVYADTDSSYFKLPYPDPSMTRDDFVTVFDAVAERVNATFCDFMQRTFNTTARRGAFIKAGREIVASRMLFVKKKKYAGLIYDLDGVRLDTDNSPGKLKVMGLDLKRADTPKFMQTFLEKILMDVLQGAQANDIIPQIRDFREAFKSRPAEEKSSPKKVSNLSKYRGMIERGEKMDLTGHRRRGEKVKGTIPGHVRASLNYNKLCDQAGDKFSMRITDGTRIIVCKLVTNVMRMDSVAYPIDEPHLSRWFRDLPFDHAAMEEVIIDKKIANLLGILDWPLVDTQILSGDEFFSF